MLERVLGQIAPMRNERVLVGFETADDAGVYLLDDGTALVQTVDFFTPVVDEPRIYGAVAAANALSDIYAMGARPLFALSVLGFPDGIVEESVLAEILQGGTEKMNEAEVPVIGGHSIQDAEIKFGYCVSGVVHPAKLFRNSGARPGDVLVLTKPLGSGIITTGIKFQKASEAAISDVTRLMLELNRNSAEALAEFEAHAATDITGFGLIGHAYEMARASQATFVFQPGQIPVLEHAKDLATKNCLPGGIMTNEHYVQKEVDWGPVSQLQRYLFLDPQTSGGLLASLPRSESAALLAAFDEKGVKACVVGKVVEKGSSLIRFEAN